MSRGCRLDLSVCRLPADDNGDWLGRREVGCGGGAVQGMEGVGDKGVGVVVDVEDERRMRGGERNGR